MNINLIEAFLKHVLFNSNEMKLFTQQLWETGDQNLLFSSRKEWKRMRMVINPTFTPAKLKEVALT